MSMDFVYDLTEKLEEQKIDFFLVTVRSGEEKDTADVFYSFKNERSVECLLEVLKNLDKEAKIDLNDSEVEDAKNNKKNAKKAAKKRGRPPRKKGGEK